jgi:hypothetical protein
MSRGAAPPPGAATHSLLPEDPGTRRRPRRSLLLTLVVAAVLLGFGVVTYLSVRGHVIDSVGDQLLTIQNSQEAAIRLWHRNESASIRGWTYEPDLRAAVLELVDDDGGGTAPDVEAQARIRSGLEGLLTAEDALGYLVVDRIGRVLAASHPAIVGRDLAPDGLALLRETLNGEAAVTTPFVLSDFFDGGVDIADRPVVAKSAPVRNATGQPVAALLVAVGSGEFGDLVGLGRFGQTGETYAVGPRGWMLSPSMMNEQLQSLGLVPSTEGSTSVHAFQIRDPGGDLTRGHDPGRPFSALPLTVAAAAVTGGGTGIDLAGYRDYRGVRVIGAWRWLDDLGFGLVTEIDYREAMAPLKPLIIAFAGLFGLAAIAAAGLVAYARIVERLRRRIDEVTELGQYTLLERLGEGGMGKVYRARHRLLARDTAVKLLKPDVMSDEAVRRFEREVQITARLRHPNTIEIYDYGRTPEGIFYYAMEYLDGYDLSRLVELNGPLAPDRVVHILRQASRSLREAHGVGLIHRDIKPMNIIVSAGGGEYDVVKVLDFGLVKEVAETGPGMTAVNIIPGTPPYIAPERMRDGGEVDGRSDIYALGAVAFNLLTGRQAYEGDTALDVAYKAMHEPPRRPAEHSDLVIPPALDALVVTMMAPEPDGRPVDVDALLDALDRIAADAPWDEARAAAWWAAHPPPCAPDPVDGSPDAAAQAPAAN